MNIWLTADSHYGHENILRHDGRPFASIKEHDEALVENHNQCVKPGDEVWHLGDFACCNVEHPAGWYLDKLHGNIHIIWGNHDHRGKMSAAACMSDGRKGKKFASAHDVYMLSVARMLPETCGKPGDHLFLSHYAHKVWPGSHHGRWHLYGHSHGNLDGGLGASMDVGVVLHGYKPINYDEVASVLRHRGLNSHHPVIDEWHKKFPGLGTLRGKEKALSILTEFLEFAKSRGVPSGQKLAYEFLGLDYDQIEKERIAANAEACEAEEQENGDAATES